MASRSSNCRICGLHLSNNNIDSHELTCLQRSQEQLETGNDYHNQNSKKNNENTEDEGTIVEVAKLEEDNSSHNSGYEDSDKINVTHPQNSPSIADMDPYPPIPVQNKAASGSESYGSQDTPSHSRATEPENLSSGSVGYGRGRNRDLFPPTKKYHYYPITCEFCRQRFQPNEMKDHQQKHHFKEVGVSSRAQSTATKMSYKSQDRDTERSKSVGAIYRRFQNCYICGKMYGSKSIKIHEPKCLEKWRIQNEQLPRNMRAPEPVKPEPLMKVSSDCNYPVPEYDPAVEAAFESHLRSLIPCVHCERTFSPDRILKHQSCCIERPRTRECVTPEGGEIPR